MKVLYPDKKVVLIDSREGGDWSLDLLFSGLVRVVGPERVVDYPPRAKHRSPVPEITGDKRRDWSAERMSLSYVEGDSPPAFARRDVVEMLGRGEIGLVFVDERPESYLLYLELRLDLHGVPVVVVAGHDRFWNSSPEYVARAYYPNVLRAMFLDNWREEYGLLPFVKPYCWSENFGHLWDQSRRERLNSEKEFDICFMGYASHHARIGVVDHVERKWGHLKNHIVLERRSDAYDSFVPKRQYFETMARSRICLNLMGAAECGKAMRFYEIPHVGSFMASQEPGPTVWPFVNGLHCEYFQTLDELDEVIDRALSRPDARELTARAGAEHLRAHHTSEARVSWMLDSLS